MCHPLLIGAVTLLLLGLIIAFLLVSLRSLLRVLLYCRVFQVGLVLFLIVWKDVTRRLAYATVCHHPPFVPSRRPACRCTFTAIRRTVCRWWSPSARAMLKRWSSISKRSAKSVMLYLLQTHVTVACLEQMQAPRVGFPTSALVASLSLTSFGCELQADEWSYAGGAHVVKRLRILSADTCQLFLCLVKSSINRFCASV